MYIARFFTVESQDGKKIIKDQPLKNHLLNVSQLAKGFGRKVNLSNFMQLAGLLHDMGKYSEEFQAYISTQRENEELSLRNGKYTRTRSDVDHGVYGAKYIYENYAHKSEVDHVTAEILMIITCYHHGGLPDCIDQNGVTPIINRFATIDRIKLAKVTKIYFEEINEDIETLFQKAKTEIIKFLGVISASKMKDGNFFYNLLIKLVYSMLIDADRLDSMCSEDGEDAWKQYLFCVDSPRPWLQYQKSLEIHMEKLKRKAVKNAGEQNVNRIRNEIYQDCGLMAGKDTNIYQLTVPTGGGKTLSSMNFAINHNQLKNRTRIIYVIPFTTIIEQNADVFRKALGEDCDLLENHSNVIDEHKAEDYELMATRWDNEVVVTTMVQFLNTFYAKGTQSLRRMHNLINTTIIFDEIQTLPIKCVNLFNSVINFLSLLNTTIVLCTATQPNLQSSSIKEVKAKEIIKDVDKKFEVLKRVEVVNDCRKEKYNASETINYILEKKKELNSLLVVLNKVKSAQEIYSKLVVQVNSEVKLFHLSSRMAPQHKKDVLEEMKIALENHDQVICISTPVIEAGVDISFEAAIRNLTKLDSVAQTAGRVNRNGEKNIGMCYVINYDEGSYANLIEIDVGAKYSWELMEQSKQYGDVLMPRAIHYYFEKFYNNADISCSFNYPIDKTFIYELLTRKQENINLNSGNELKTPIRFCRFQIAEAAAKFEVIDGEMVSVIVPYKKGIKIIDEIHQLDQFSSTKHRKEIMEKVKPFVTNIYRHDLKILLTQGAIYMNDVLGVYILSMGYYDSNLGLRSEASAEAFCL